MIYWKGCTIKVYKTGKESKVVWEIKERTDGELVLLEGISVLCDDGKAKEA